MSNNTIKKSLAVAMGATFAAALTAAPVASADSNPFGMSELSSGYMQLAADEGKCGAKEAKPEGKCGEGKMKTEGKCGEGKCGEKRKMHEGKCGEGKCGEGMMKKESKCGAGKSE